MIIPFSSFYGDCISVCISIVTSYSLHTLSIPLTHLTFLTTISFLTTRFQHSPPTFSVLPHALPARHSRLHNQHSLHTSARPWHTPFVLPKRFQHLTTPSTLPLHPSCSLYVLSTLTHAISTHYTPPHRLGTRPSRGGSRWKLIE